MSGHWPAIGIGESGFFGRDLVQHLANSVNGEDGDSVLPALMISTIHPGKFKETTSGYRFADIAPGIADDKLVLIPLRGVCKDSTEVISLIERVFKDIAAKRPLTQFQI